MLIKLLPIMPNIFSTYKKPLFNTLPLYLLVLLFTLPFLLRLRAQPISSYILENISFILILLLVLSCGIQGRLWHKAPKATWYFLALAIFWYLQSLYLSLPFVGQSYFAIGVFLGLAVLAFALRGLVLAFGREKIVLFITLALVIGATIEFGIGLLQLLKLESFYQGLIVKSPNISTIIGQLGQRNHFGHYLMWGLVSVCYLHAIGKLRLFFSVFLLFALAIGLSLAGSRTVVLYTLVVFILTILWSLRMQNFASKRLLNITLFGLVLLLLLQWLLPYLLDWFGIPFSSGVNRLITSSGGRRWYEWLKAWLIFKEHPFWGVGWTGYAQAAYQLDILPAFIHEPKESGLFVHSHSLITQLLAEMGSLGTTLVLCGFVWVIWRYFTETAVLENWFLLSLMGVSLSHSLVEYPLWYVYFLAPFAVFMSLALPTEKETLPKKYWLNGSAVLLLTACLLAYCIHLITVYDQLQRYHSLSHVEHAKDIRIQKLESLVKQEPLFQFYTLYVLDLFYTPTKKINKRAKEVNQIVTDYRAYSYPLLRRAMYEDFSGETIQAQATLAHMNTYYQVLVPEFLGVLGRAKHHPELLRQTLHTCQKLKVNNPKIKCVYLKDTGGAKNRVK